MNGASGEAIRFLTMLPAGMARGVTQRRIG
jgi:hypothetical protein